METLVANNMEKEETFEAKVSFEFNPHTPAAQKIADEVFFDVSKVTKSIFLYRTSRTPLRFLMRIFWKIPI